MLLGFWLGDPDVRFGVRGEEPTKPSLCAVRHSGPEMTLPGIHPPGLGNVSPPSTSTPANPILRGQSCRCPPEGALAPSVAGSANCDFLAVGFSGWLPSAFAGQVPTALQTPTRFDISSLSSLSAPLRPHGQRARLDALQPSGPRPAHWSLGNCTPRTCSGGCLPSRAAQAASRTPSRMTRSPPSPL